MAGFLERKDRKVIPRWRSFRTTAALSELNSSESKPKPDSPERDFLADKARDWEEHKTLWHASDLVGAGIVLGRQAEVEEAARFIQLHRDKAPETAGLLAARALAEKEGVYGPARSEVGNDPLSLYGRIHELRVLCAEYPANSVSWVDLALYYTILGKSERAERALRTAIQLDPQNRFVVRSAARFYIHQGRPDHAHWLISRAESTASDSWLQAAEIAVASAAGLKPRTTKNAFRMLSDESRSPRQVSELASALATLEFENGNHVAARRLFRKALSAPTENSVAQAEWASKHLGSLNVQVNHYNVPRLFEARAWHAYAGQDWAAAYQAASGWLGDQPFSSRPAMVASYVASVLLEDHQKAKELLQRSLIANPSEPGLLNNLAFALASLGQIEEADRTLAGIDFQDLDGTAEVTLLATKGLVRFRQGLVEEGRSLYHDSINRAKESGLFKYEAIAAINLAREEILASSSEAQTSFDRAITLAARENYPDVQIVRARLQELHRATVGGSSSKHSRD